MRLDQDSTSAFNTHFKSGKFSYAEKVMTADILITLNGAIVNFLDPNGGTWNVTLPPPEKGRFYVIINTGSSGSLVVKSFTGTTITTLDPDESTLLFASDLEWAALSGGSSAAIGVFTNLLDGLVPAPNSVTPGSLFLRDDQQWATAGSGPGASDAFAHMSDGTTVAHAAGADTFRFRSSSGKISVTVTNNEAVFGDNVNLSVIEAAVNHNALLNYVANEHINHTSVSVLAGLGLTGGGTIAADRTLAFSPAGLTINASPVLTDYAVMDLAAGGPRRTLWSSINAILNITSLVGYTANKFIDHSTVSIVASTGLTGGGDLTTSRSLAIDWNGLTTDTPATADLLAFFDASGVDHNKCTIGALTAIMDHNSLLNYVADQHVAHSSVSISTTEGIQGGGTIAATRTLKLDINTLTQDASPDLAADFVATWDVSASLHKKVLLNAIGGGGGAAVANNTGTIGLTRVNGSAATAMRSDGAPPLDQAITPTWTGAHIFQGQVTMEGQAVSPLQTLTDGATISTWDTSLGQKAKVTLGAAGRTMAAPTNTVEGTTYFLWVIQDGTGNRTITTWNAAFDFGAAGAPTLTTTASKADLLTFEAINIASSLKMRYTGIAKGFG